jgi:predicted secreted acid phosphatase
MQLILEDRPQAIRIGLVSGGKSDLNGFAKSDSQGVDKAPDCRHRTGQALVLRGFGKMAFDRGRTRLWSGTKKPALVLDLDETSLTNWPNLIADDFGFIADGPCEVLPAGPCGFNQWILKGSARAVAPARKLLEAAKAKGVAVIFITGRPDGQRDITILDLDHAGYEGWSELRTRPARDGLLTVQEFKSAVRAKVEAEGYTIIANVGDQMSDIEGGAFRMPLQGAQSVLFHPLRRG